MVARRSAAMPFWSYVNSIGSLASPTFVMRKRSRRTRAQYAHSWDRRRARKCPQRAAAAIERALQPERVYSVMFGEQIQHVHFVLMPRGREVPVEHRSAALILNQTQYIDPEAALQATVRLREALRRQ